MSTEIERLAFAAASMMIMVAPSELFTNIPVLASKVAQHLAGIVSTRSCHFNVDTVDIEEVFNNADFRKYLGKNKYTCNQVCFRQTNLKGNVHAYEVIFNVHHKTPVSLADAFAQVEALQLVIVSGICDMKKKRDVLKNIKRKQSNFVSPSPEKRQRINDIEEHYDVLIEQPEPEPQAEPEHILKLKLGRPVDMDPQQLRRDKLKLQKINEATVTST